LAFLSCETETNNVYEETFPSDFKILLPQDIPLPNFPIDNEYSKERAELGRMLFYDPILSEDSTISCGSCHDPKLAFTDGKQVSEGVKDRQTKRNSPTLANVAYQEFLLSEGSLNTLEKQILVPIQEHNELNNNILKIAEKLNKIEDYRERSIKAYGRNPDAFVITRAIANFERTIVSFNSKYDRVKRNEEKFSNNELLGEKLFFGKANCSKCHDGILFTNQKFENNGLYENYLDTGRMHFTNLESDRSLFKVPTLRNISITSPYMHSGIFNDLNSIVNHYNDGGKLYKNKSIEIKKLYLTIEEKEALVSFLKTLTDEEFMSKKLYQKAK
jgi:cytochrome c peroxidase